MNINELMLQYNSNNYLDFICVSNKIKMNSYDDEDEYLSVSSVNCVTAISTRYDNKGKHLYSRNPEVTSL